MCCIHLFNELGEITQGNDRKAVDNVKEIIGSQINSNTGEDRKIITILVTNNETISNYHARVVCFLQVQDTSLIF